MVNFWRIIQSNALFSSPLVRALVGSDCSRTLLLLSVCSWLAGWLSEQQQHQKEFVVVLVACGFFPVCLAGRLRWALRFKPQIFAQYFTSFLLLLISFSSSTFYCHSHTIQGAHAYCLSVYLCVCVCFFAITIELQADRLSLVARKNCSLNCRIEFTNNNNSKE